MEEWICTVNDLGFHYKRGGRAVLKGLSLSLHKGEILGIRGENGAGKSTLLKAIAGILPYDKGEVLIPKEIKKNLSYLPQDLSLYESLSALENLYFYGKILGLPAKVIFTRAHWLLKELGLEDILLLDEPTVGCDNESYDRILALLRKMKAQGTAMLLISHGRGELEEMADRIVYLEEGRIV